MSDTIAQLIYGPSVPATQAIRTAALAAPFLVLTHRAYADLVHEVGSDDDAVRWLYRLAGEVDGPIDKRACPQCAMVAPSERFARIEALGWPVQCPACGHVGPVVTFKIVRR
jgi:hypothetical protein